MEKSDSTVPHPKLVALARLVKQHTFKENKWKAVAYSGLALPWLENVKSIFLRNVPITVKIEVPLSHSAEFFVHFPEGYTPEEKSEVFVDRSVFPLLEGADFYLCDLMGLEVQSDLGLFRVLGYLENGDPSKGATALNLRLGSVELVKGSTLEVEVPLPFLKRKESSWFLEDVELWVDRDE